MSAEQETAEKPVDQSAEDAGKTIEEINEEIEKELEEELSKEEADPVAELQQEVLKWKEAAVRSAADLENFRKRMTREKADAIRFGNQKLIEQLLPVIDNFSMGMMAAEQDSGSMIYMGMQMVQKQLDDFLASQGVTVVELNPGDEFDPNLHDAMSQEVSEDFAEGQIIRIIRKGFVMGDRLIRPANVIVSQGAEAPAEEVAETEEKNEEASEA